jgi:hypothetical protein
MKKNIWDIYNESVVGVYHKHQEAKIGKMIEKAVKKSLDVPRSSNAQINDVEYTESWMKSKHEAKSRKMKIKSLKPSQNEFSEEKISNMMLDDSFNPFSMKYFVSEDNRLLDGHHSWAYGNIVDENQYVDVVKIPKTYEQSRKILHHMKNTERKDVSEGTKAEYQKFLKDKLKKDGYKSIADIPKDKQKKFWNEVEKEYDKEEKTSKKENRNRRGYRNRNRNRRVSEGTAEQYQTFLNNKLKDEGYSSIGDIPRDKIGQFFSEIPNEYDKETGKAKNERRNRISRRRKFYEQKSSNAHYGRRRK